MTPSADRFAREGYAIFPDVLDRELVDEAARHVEWLMARHPERRPEDLNHELVGDDPFWVRLISDDRLLDVAEQFIGPDIAVFASHYIVKPPGDGQPVLWHQDAAYWPLDPMEVVTLWLAVDDSVPENGCLRVIPGTHRRDVAAIRARTDVDNLLSSETAMDDVDESRAVDLVLTRGSVSVHHPNIVHGSNPNRSTRRRAGLAIRYIPTSTRINVPGWPCAFHVRGDARPDVNEYRERPRFDSARHMPFRGCEAQPIAVS
jgi:hypothetical protein